MSSRYASIARAARLVPDSSEGSGAAAAAGFFAALLSGGFVAALAAEKQPPSQAAVVAASRETAPGASFAGFSLISDEKKRQVFFNYERRIRDFSSSDKIFEYFASMKDPKDGTLYMTPMDLMRSLVPVYPPSESSMLRSGSLPGETTAGLASSTLPEAHPDKGSVFMLFDVDGDGRISWDEYKIILALLAMSVEDLMIVFNMLDTDGSGTIEEPEFTAVLDALMNNLRAARVVAVTRSGLVAHQGAEGERPALLDHLFGKDGKGRMTLKQFEGFLMSLHSELRDLEFRHYDQDESKTICGRDFALSIAASAPLSEISGLVAQIDRDVPSDLLKRQISREDFMAFEMLCRKIRQLSAALSFSKFVRGNVTREELGRAFRICAGKGGKVPGPAVVDLCFHAFGGSTEGGFEVAQFLRAVRGRAQLKILDASTSVSSEVYGAQAPGIFACLANCIRN